MSSQFSEESSFLAGVKEKVRCRKQAFPLGKHRGKGRARMISILWHISFMSRWGSFKAWEGRGEAMFRITGFQGLWPVLVSLLLKPLPTSQRTVASFQQGFSADPPWFRRCCCFAVACYPQWLPFQAMSRKGLWPPSCVSQNLGILLTCSLTRSQDLPGSLLSPSADVPIQLSSGGGPGGGWLPNGGPHSAASAC